MQVLSLDQITLVEIDSRIILKSHRRSLMHPLGSSTCLVVARCNFIESLPHQIWTILK